MAELAALLEELAKYDKAQDFDGLRRVREEIATGHPDTPEACEALYKIGIDLLYRARDFDTAVDYFQRAAKHKDAYWGPAARTSLGLCYLHQKRTQKACFELTRVGYTEMASPHSITALTFLETVWQSESNTEEVERVRKERLRQLRQLVKDLQGGSNQRDHGYYLYQLALAEHDAGETTQAEAHLKQAQALGPKVLGAELFATISAGFR